MNRIAIWAVSALLLASPMPALSFEEAGAVRWGADYRRISMKNGTAADCAKACAKDARCKSWMFARPGVEERDGACHLKSGARSSVSDAPGAPSQALTGAVRKPSDGASGGLSLMPSSMTESVGTLIGLKPTGLTGSIGSGTSKARMPAIPPLRPAVKVPATRAPAGIQPEGWNN